MRLFEFVRRPKVQFEKAIYFPGYPVKCEEYDPFNKENAIRTGQGDGYSVFDDYKKRFKSYSIIEKKG